MSNTRTGCPERLCSLHLWRILKTRLETVLGHLLLLTLLEQAGWANQPKQFCISPATSFDKNPPLMCNCLLKNYIALSSLGSLTPLHPFNMGFHNLMFPRLYLHGIASSVIHISSILSPYLQTCLFIPLLPDVSSYYFLLVCSDSLSLWSVHLCAALCFP